MNWGFYNYCWCYVPCKLELKPHFIQHLCFVMNAGTAKKVNAWTTCHRILLAWQKIRYGWPSRITVLSHISSITYFLNKSFFYPHWYIFIPWKALIFENSWNRNWWVFSQNNSCYGFLNIQCYRRINIDLKKIIRIDGVMGQFVTLMS